jgi:hypothetical protein
VTAGALISVPVQPSGDQARQWLVDELAKAPYQQAKPTPFDLIAQAVLKWFQDLFLNSRTGTPTVLLVVALVVVVAVVVAAVLFYGLPRFNRRSRAAASLFGDDDRRTADELRAAARRALAGGDFSAAIVERFRALARGLDERTVVAVFPGTTATGFARRAADAFPDEREGLRAAADVFDAVRYAGRLGTRDEAERIAALDDRVAAARPRLAEAVPA